MRARAIVMLCLAMLMGSESVSASEMGAIPIELFLPGGQHEPLVALPAGAIRGRLIGIDLAAIAPPVLSAEYSPSLPIALDLFDDASFAGALDRIEVRSPTSFTWIGH